MMTTEIKKSELALKRKLRLIDRQLLALYDRETYPGHLTGQSEFYVQRWVHERRLVLHAQREMILWMFGGKYV